MLYQELKRGLPAGLRSKTMNLLVVISTHITCEGPIRHRKRAGRGNALGLGGGESACDEHALTKRCASLLKNELFTVKTAGPNNGGN